MPIGALLLIKCCLPKTGIPMKSIGLNLELTQVSIAPEDDRPAITGSLSLGGEAQEISFLLCPNLEPELHRQWLRSNLGAIAEAIALAIEPYPQTQKKPPDWAID
jgi:hypothetical protein